MRIIKIASPADQIWGIRIRHRYLSLAGPAWPVLFSERHRAGIRVLPLWKGWRIRLKTDRAALDATRPEA